MQILLANHSSYPSPLPSPGADVATAVRTAIAVQDSAGLDVVTDGMPDPVDPLLQALVGLSGVRIDPATRVNAAGRTVLQPVVHGTLARRDSRLVHAYRQATAATRTQVKPVLTGPYTLAGLARIESAVYPSHRALAEHVSELLATELAELVAAGARVMQVDEPLILQHPEDIREARQLLEPLMEATRGRAELWLSAYGAEAEPLYAQLASLPADVVGVDLCAGPRLIDLIASVGAGKVLALGIVAGSDARLEPADERAAVCRRVLQRYPHDRIYLQPSCGLASLSWDDAAAKIRALAAIRARLAPDAPAT